MSWRYEALYVLLWALSIFPGELAPADLTVEVDDLVCRFMEAARNDVVGEKQRLRPAAEILDALDLAWLQHWIVRQAALKGIEIVELNPSVVRERHLALNWLTRFQNVGDISWHNIDTPT